MKTIKKIHDTTESKYYSSLDSLPVNLAPYKQFPQGWDYLDSYPNPMGSFNLPSGTAIDPTQVLLSITGLELKESEKLISLPYQLEEANSKIRFLTTEFSKLKIRNKELLAHIQNIKKELNVTKLDRISNYEDNWNGFESKKFNKKLINKVYRLLLDSSLKIQPSVFPTQRNSIQLEFRIDNFFIEVEIFEDEFEMNIENEITEKVEFFEKTDWKTVIDKLNELQSA